MLNVSAKWVNGDESGSSAPLSLTAAIFSIEQPHDVAHGLLYAQSFQFLKCRYIVFIELFFL